jgi:hypothetical protein
MRDHPQESETSDSWSTVETLHAPIRRLILRVVLLGGTSREMTLPCSKMAGRLETCGWSRVVARSLYGGTSVERLRRLPFGGHLADQGGV